MSAASARIEELERKVEILTVALEVMVEAREASEELTETRLDELDACCWRILRAQVSR